jgi:hypothetical protein
LEKSKKYVELLWAGKYDRFEKGEKIPKVKEGFLKFKSSLKKVRELDEDKD